MTHPYKSQPDRAFWMRSVADRSALDLGELSAPLDLRMSDRFATAGSCFAQHIGHNLEKRGARFLNVERRPGFVPVAREKEFGYGIYSARYGNIYTARQLLQLIREVRGEWEPPEPVWERDGRYYDAQRPSVDPSGHATHEDVLTVREAHLAAVRGLFQRMDVLVFTLGLTEAWELAGGDMVFATAPGVIAGDYDAAAYRLANYTYPEVRDDLETALALLRDMNPGVRLLLTVSPVPLMATATDDHVLVATTYSKSTLRAVAGDMARAHDGVMYFPSYEIITAHPTRGFFFQPDMREVNPRGVAFVMEHFFAAMDGAGGQGGGLLPDETVEIVCDEERIDGAD